MSKKRAANKRSKKMAGESVSEVDYSLAHL
jgi:hypothetical protein